MRRGIDTLISGAAILAMLAACSPLRPESTPTSAPRTMEVLPTRTLPPGVYAELGGVQITQENIRNDIDANLDPTLIKECANVIKSMYTNMPASAVQLPAPEGFIAQMNVYSQQIEGRNNLVIAPNLVQTFVQNNTIYFGVDLYLPPAFDENGFASETVANHECAHFAQFVALMEYLLRIQRDAFGSISDRQVTAAFKQFFYSKGTDNFLEPAATYVEIATALQNKDTRIEDFKHSSYNDQSTFGSLFFDKFINIFGEQPPQSITPDTTTDEWNKWETFILAEYP